MTIQVGKGVIYDFYDIPEDQLEDIESWTGAAIKIREVTDDVLHMAIRFSPIGRARDDQFATIAGSHYKAGTSFAGRFRYRQAVGNRAPHALWVHEGTSNARFPVHARGANWMGPVRIGGGIGEVGLTGGPKEGVQRHGLTASWVAYPSFVYFEFYEWKGQSANGWLARAGQAAYRMPRNH